MRFLDWPFSHWRRSALLLLWAGNWVLWAGDFVRSDLVFLFRNTFSALGFVEGDSLTLGF